MPSHRLVLEKDSLVHQWLLEWNDSVFALKDPDGSSVLEADAALAHRLPELDELYMKDRVVFESPHGSLKFRPQPEAAKDLRAFVEAGLGRDDEYRQFLKTSARRAAAFGALLFILGGGLFGGYVWVASWAPDPDPGHWLHWIGWLIGFGVIVLLSVALAGPYMCWLALRQYRRVARIERNASSR